MQASMSSGSGNRRPRGVRFGVGSASVLGLWIATGQLPLARSLTDADVPCPAEALLCLADDECATCVTALQEVANSATDVLGDFAECNDLYADVCTFVSNAGCNVTNDFFVDFATCVAVETFGCDTFTSCEDAVIGAADGTPAPVVAGSQGPTEAVVADDTAAPTEALAATESPTPASTDRDADGIATPSPTINTGGASNGVDKRASAGMVSALAVMLVAAFVAPLLV